MVPSGRRAGIHPCLVGQPGEPKPFIESSYRIYGSHPDDVWPKIMANRKARLGKDFADWYDAAGNRKPDIPKKPPTHVDKRTEKRAERFCIARLPSEEQLEKVLRILPAEKVA